MKGKIVCDSSVMVKWVSSTGENYLKQADKILKDTQNNQTQLFAPELSKYEVGNALLKGKGLSPTQAMLLLGTVYSMPIEFIPESLELAEKSYLYAKKYDITYYDASFVSLTHALNATLVTDNPKHQAKVVGVKVTPLEDYI